MALLDFLGKDVGGYAVGPQQTGQAGVPQTGLTYGNIAQAALQMGSKPGSSGPMFGGLLGKQGMPVQGAVTNALQPLAEQPGTIMPQQKQGGSGDIWSWILSLLG